MSERERAARDCDACGGLSACSDCGEVNRQHPRIKSYKRIWLLQDHWEGEPCQVWCDHPAPGIGQEEEDADGPYIHVNEIRKLIKVERDGLRLACHNCCCISLGDGILDEFEELIKEGV